ncbi:hypothetical protein [Oceanobacillus halotolerans]|uniref:hypothetical protein n=1 Tax=Oceanobacillus halotolerans TaxID=2663380 RepID=UPI0013D955A5|nr:hypothetical protein [Oceanobacillus halotolerans]
MSIQQISHRTSNKVGPLSMQLKPGQIIQGKIQKIFPNQSAKVQLGSRHMVAQLEASLTVGSNYYFQVKSAKDVIHLKVLGQSLEQDEQTSLANLMKQLGLKTNKSNVQFIQSLIQEKIPFDKTQLGNAFVLLNGTDGNSEIQAVLKEMISRNIPINNSTFQALYTKQTSTISEQFQDMVQILRQDTTDIPNKQQLLERLNGLLERPSLKGELSLLTNPKELFLSHMRSVLQQTGTTYENQLANNLVQSQSNTIKSILLQLVQKGGGIVHERSQKLLHFLNGLQIQSVNETPTFIQASLQLPGNKIGLRKDIDMEFEGNKTKEGKIDPDFCRILFYLDLANLKETIVDMHIQKRTVTITIWNNHPNLIEQALVFKPELKKGLVELDYQLSTINTKHLQEKQESTKHKALKAYQSTYQGVDYRI